MKSETNFIVTRVDFRGVGVWEGQCHTRCQDFLEKSPKKRRFGGDFGNVLGKHCKKNYLFRKILDLGSQNISFASPLEALSRENRDQRWLSCTLKLIEE